MRNYKTFKKAIPILGVIVLILVIICFGLTKLENIVLSNPNDGAMDHASSKTVVVDGVRYFPRQDITVLMVLGIDQYGEVESSEFFRNKGACDLVALLVFDEKNEVCNILQLNRDTMLEMNVLGIDGSYAGTAYAQLALAHTYGSGLEDSCENTKETLTDFLKGVCIDHYVSLNMEAVPIINDAVGGVEVYVTEDFSEVNPMIHKGEMLLKGEQALHYVRTRREVGDSMNLSRMERHREYIRGFLQSYEAASETHDGFTMDLLEQLLPYMVTDSSLNTLSSMLDRYEEYELGEIVSPEGRNELEGNYMCFYVDEASLDELILRLFYAPKE